MVDSSIDAELLAGCKQLDDRLSTLVSNRVSSYIYEKQKNSDCEENIYEILHEICVQNSQVDELSALNDPENIMQEYIIYLKNFYVDVLSLIQKNIEAPALAISSECPKDINALIELLILNSTIQPNTAKCFSLFIFSNKFKIGIALLFICSFIFYINDKSILPTSFPKNVHEFDFWFSTDIVQYVNSHSDPFIRKEMISTTISDEGKNFFQEMLNHLLCPMMEKIGSTTYIKGFEIIAEYGIEIACILDSIENTYTMMSTIISSYSNISTEICMKIILPLIASYEQFEQKKYFSILAKKLLMQNKDSYPDKIAFLVSSNWNSTSIYNLILASVSENAVQCFKELLSSITNSDYNHVSSICTQLLNSLYQSHSDDIIQIFKQTAIAPLMSIMGLDEDGNDVSVTDSSHTNTNFQISADSVENSIIICHALINNALLRPWCEIIIKPLFMLHMTKSDFVPNHHRDIEALINYCLLYIEDPSSTMICLFSKPFTTYLKEIALYPSYAKYDLGIELKEENNAILDDAPKKIQIEIAITSNGVWDFKCNEVDFESYLTHYFNEQALEEWMNQTEMLFAIIKKAPTNVQKTIIRILYQFFLDQMLFGNNDDSDWKSSLISATRECNSMELEANVDLFLRHAYEVSKAIVDKIMIHCDLKLLAGVERLQDILFCIISSDNEMAVERALSIAIIFIKNCSVSAETNKFMIDVFPSILALCSSETLHIQEKAIEFNDIILKSFVGRAAELVEGNKDAIYDELKNKLENNGQESVSFVLNELTELIDDNSHTIPFESEKMLALWEMAFTNVSIDILKAHESSIFKAGLIYPDDTLCLIAKLIEGSLSVNAEEDKERIMLWVRLIKLMQDDEKFELNDTSVIAYINSINKTKSEQYEIVHEMLSTITGFKYLPADCKSVLFSILMRECSSTDSHVQLKIPDIILHLLRSWPIESLIEDIKTIQEIIRILMQANQPAITAKCNECEAIIQKHGIGTFIN